MLGALVKGSTVLFGDNQSMVSNTSLPHSMLKKRQCANNYHQVCEAVAAGVVNIVHCDTQYNLADMGTKALSRNTHQFLLHNQTFPSVLSAGECKPDTSGEVEASDLNTKNAKLVLSVQSTLDCDVVKSLSEEDGRFYRLVSTSEYVSGTNLYDTEKDM